MVKNQHFDNIKYVKYLVILLVNVFFIGCIIKASYFDLPMDTNGIFSLIMLLLLVLYNLCIFVISYALSDIKYKQIILTILSALPLFLIIYGVIS